ncbi:MAG: hypothetical protein ACI351_00150 [Candidatus Avelusimicrobium sp.]|uniref:hypothetical protein n=1 Tax=Candidatus Avelusimicrobium sp. TaxID=3048833 RepID=UPI003F02079B
MKILNFLKNKSGKLVIGAPQVLTIAGVGMMATYGAFKTDQILDNDIPLRALSSVAASSSAYDGLNRRADGMLTSMNIQNRAGGKGVAVGADRERLEGYTSKNDFGLTAADNLEAKFSASGIGSAARISSSDGLGTGGVDLKEIPAGGETGTMGSSPSGVPSVSVLQGSAATPAAASASSSNSGGRLAAASMARASGNSFNATFGSTGGMVSGGTSGGRNAGSSRASGSEGYNFSGAMPSGSNVVSSYETSLGGRGSGSTFLAGGRNANFGRSGRRVNEKDDLKKISKMSADVAKDRNRGTVAGARPFLANTATSAGMSIDGGADTTTTGSADFAAPESRNLKALGDWGQKQEDNSKERSKARTRLLWMTLALIAATLVTMSFAGGLIFKGRLEIWQGQLLLSMSQMPYCSGLKAMGLQQIAKGKLHMTLGWVAIGVTAAYAATVLGFASSYLSKYGGGFMPILSLLVSVGAIAGLTALGIKAMQGALSSTEIAKFQLQATKALKLAGVAGASQVAQQVIGEAASK